MFDSNYARVEANAHWAELCLTTPDIPAAANPAAKQHNPDWTLLGEYDWHYTVAIGHFGDNQPENEQRGKPATRSATTSRTSTKSNYVHTSTGYTLALTCTSRAGSNLYPAPGVDPELVCRQGPPDFESGRAT